MRSSFTEEIGFRHVECGRCLFPFYVPGSCVTGSRWKEPVWCPSCGENAMRAVPETEKLRRQNAGLRGALARMKKEAKP